MNSTSHYLYICRLNVLFFTVECQYDSLSQPESTASVLFHDTNFELDDMVLFYESEEFNGQSLKSCDQTPRLYLIDVPDSISSNIAACTSHFF